MTTTTHRDLLVWSLGMDLAEQVYRATAAFPDQERFGLQSQMRRAAVSIPCNIAEGHGRLAAGEMRHFLGVARGSLRELETQIELAGRMGYIEPAHLPRLTDLTATLAIKLTRFITTISETDVSTRSRSARPPGQAAARSRSAKPEQP
jgi:four helix bundle protein